MRLVIEEQSLWLVPAGLAIYFMLWVLWSWVREEQRRDRVNNRVIRAGFVLPHSKHTDNDRLMHFRW